MASDWRHGYITDQIYTAGYRDHISPAAINLALLACGRTPFALEREFTYCELGIGLGVSLALHAACFPSGQFFGVDFNSEHIDIAKKHARGLQNITLEDASFEEWAENDTLPKFDMISLHGIYSWVNAEVREHIIRLIHKRLKHNGVVSISYNCLPGHAATTVIRKIMEIEMDPGRTSRDNLAGLAGFLKQFKRWNPNCAHTLPRLSTHVDRIIEAKDPNYLAHEYVNQEQKAFWFDEVASDMRRARLQYAGSHNLVSNLPKLNFSDSVIEYLSKMNDPLRVEIIRDLMHDPTFRRDLFVRGRASEGQSERLANWQNLFFCMLVEAGKLPESLQVPLNPPVPEDKETAQRSVARTQINDEMHKAIFSLLSKGPASFADIQKASGQNNPGRTIEILILLAANNIIFPTLDKTGKIDAKLRSRLQKWHSDSFDTTRAAAQGMTFGSALTGSGVHLPAVEALAWSALEGKAFNEVDNAAIARKAVEQLFRHQRVPIKDGTPIRDPQKAQEWLLEVINEFEQKKVGTLQKHGIL